MPISRSTRNLILLLPAAGLIYGAVRLAAKPAQKASDTAVIGKQADGTYFVPTGQTLSPVGTNLTFEGRPVDMAMRPDGKMLALMCQRGTRLFDTQTQQFLPNQVAGTHNFGGIAWSKDGYTLYSTGMDAGRTFQNYGELAPLSSIKSHSDTAYNTKVPVTPDRNADVARCERILKDLEGGKSLAQLTTIWFSNDHTSGTRPGSYTPESDIADNDLAIGRLIDTLSHSKKYWQDEPTAIFIVEDDAQGGLDHVEGHRTVGLVVSPFNKRGQIFSTNFNQLNMIRTIEAILGIPPLNQFDAAAITMRAVFQEKADYQPYTVRKNQVALNLINPPLQKLTAAPRHWAAVSAQLDFSSPDRADPEQLTEVLWHHTHGEEAYPPPTASR